MSDIDLNGRIRLVPLVATLAGISRPALDLDLVLTLALEGKVQLYARVPPDRVVYVDSTLPVTTGRRFSGPWTGVMGGDEARYTPQSDRILPDVNFLRLDGDLAEDFQMTVRWTRAGWASDITFPSGLQPHRRADLAKEGWLEPCEFGTALVVCPALTPEEVEQWHRVSRKHLRVPLDDVYVDEQVTVILKYGYAPIRDASEYLYQVEGVYVLYCAAALFYAELKDAPRGTKKNTSKKTAARSTQNDIVERAAAWMREKLPALGNTDAQQVAKLINPGLRRNSGVDKKDQKVFGSGVLGNAVFSTNYQQEDFVTDELALVLYVTERFLQNQAESKDPLWKPTACVQIENEFERLGFNKREREALARLVLYPYSKPEIRPAQDRVDQ
ncbi:hypothetical protein [Dyella sp. GSA-30]|jgi:hypothetical protein|uniref:hypothetical protein n=1 Tax=Dyella sp. GSA-30 TaxID=2994496 RepID=UPI002493743B|nr:hypothetical protein [Dyella sp. GSA-30]BDU22238.1 hypothetical protein DYGSA30_36950 [Dyella sp. GSA-30]